MVRWSQIRQGLEVVLGRFAPFTVVTECERRACLSVLEQVRREELNRVTGDSVLASSSFASAGGLDELVGIRDRWTGQVVGTARGTPADVLMDRAGAVREYHLDRIPASLRRRVWIGTRLATLPAYRGGPATLLMLRHMYAEGLKRDAVATIITCEPGLLRTYLRMGFVAVGPVHASATGGFRVPIALPFHDRARLVEHRSPLLAILDATPGPWPTEGVTWSQGFVGEDAVETGVSRYDPAVAIHRALCTGISEVGTRRLLGGALRVRCTPGQRIVAAGDGGRSWGWVQRGGAVLAHRSGGHHYLAPGAVFGPSVGATGGRHPVDVVAMPGTEVVLLSRSAVDRLARNDRATLRQTLGQVSAAQGYALPSAAAVEVAPSLLPTARRAARPTVTEAMPRAA